MANSLVATTSTEGLKPLGTAPQRSYELIASTLEGRDAATLFAEPVSSDFGDAVDWYTALPGRAVAAADLDEEARDRLLARLETLVAETRAVADSVLAENPEKSDTQRLAESLRNALEVPGEDSIFAMVEEDGTARPVLVNWAWVADRQSVVRGVLTGRDTRGPAPAARAADPMRNTGTLAPGRPVHEAGATRANPMLLWWLYWLGWLLLALMAAAILLLLIAPCALRLPMMPDHCARGAAEASREERLASVLRDEITTLERQLGIADRACQPPVQRPAFLPPLRQAVAPPRQSEPPIFDRAEVQGRIDRSGAEIGDLTFSLLWDGPDDLDLEVICPTGERLFWGTRTACNGRKDVDTSVGTPSPEPLENVFFNTPVPGRYTLRVTMPTSRSNGAPRGFLLQIRDGAEVSTLDGLVSGRQREWTATFEFEER